MMAPLGKGCFFGTALVLVAVMCAQGGEIELENAAGTSSDASCLLQAANVQPVVLSSVEKGDNNEDENENKDKNEVPEKAAAEVSKEDFGAFLQNSPGQSIQHICVSGNRAFSLVQDSILPPGNTLEEFELKSKLNPENQCKAWQHAVGHSLFTISPTIEDRCAARLNLQLLTCDVLVHAHESDDCSDLYKFRLMANHLAAPLLLVHSGNSLASCYEQRLSENAPVLGGTAALLALNTVPQFLVDTLQEKAGGASHFRAALKLALVRNNEAQLPLIEASSLPGDASSLREYLVSRGSQPGAAVDVMIELMKDAHGFTADMSALQMTKHMLPRSRMTKKSNLTHREEDALVLDSGEDNMMKAGFVGGDGPMVIFPNIVGRPKENDRGKEIYVGDEAQAKRGILHLKYPVFHGIIANFDDMVAVWHHTFADKLRVAPEEHPVLLTESPLNPKSAREKTTALMFEEFRVPKMYLANRGSLPLFASKRTTGVVLNIGDDVTHVVPVYEGTTLPHAIERLDLGGRDVNTYLIKMLYESGHSQRDLTEEILRDILEKRSYFAYDFDREYAAFDRKDDETQYELPDGQLVRLGFEPVRAAEVLFEPRKEGVLMGTPGVHQAIFNSIMKCDKAIQKDLYSNIVLSGTYSRLDGFAKRMAKELRELAPPRMRVEVVSSMKYSHWIGGSVLGAQVLQKKEMSISRRDYDKFGPSVVHRKWHQ